jgi:CRISPR-associated protein Csm3
MWRGTMFKNTHNLMKISTFITPQTPLLVSSGKTFDVTRPDMEFMRVKTSYGETIYIPGSSIKGVLRYGLEAILGEKENEKQKVCIISEKMCHEKYKFKRDKRNKLPYRYHCPVCRLFGSAELASRLEVSDMFPFCFKDSEDEKITKIKDIEKMLTSRTGIKIDRKTGKAKGGALFEYEILGGGGFHGEFFLTNYELYQPALLFSLFSLSNEGFLRFGHSKSRGLGVLNFKIESMQILQMGRLKGNQLKGVGMLSDYDEEYDFYMKEKDIINKEYPNEKNALYSKFEFTKKETLHELQNKFKGINQMFLEE